MKPVMELGARLKALTKYVPGGTVAADIGTDHAYVPVYLVLNKVCSQVIAGDVAPGPLAAARHTVERYGLQDSITLRQGNGLQVLGAGEAQTIIIAGMGGNSIKEVLQASPAVAQAADRLILQPMNSEGELRLWLAREGWFIADELLISDGGKIYVIIVVERGSEREKNDFLLEIGPRLVEKKDPLLGQYLGEIEKHCLQILNGLAKSRGREIGRKSAVYAQKLAKLKEVKKWL